MEDFEIEPLYEDDDYLSQFIDEEEVKKVGKIIEEEELEDEEVEEVSEWFTPDFKEALEKSRYKTRVSNFRNSNTSFGSFTDDIIRKESGGNYQATNPNSSAAGKYQFLWNTWGSKIADFTGVQSKQEFLNNPQAQDSFYNDYYLPQELLPAVKRLKNKGFNLDTDTLAKLVHFRGEQGAYNYLTGKEGDQPESYNMRTSQYIRQTGGYTYAQSGILSYNANGKIGVSDTLYNLLNRKDENPNSIDNNTSESTNTVNSNNNTDNYSPKTRDLNVRNPNINPDRADLRENFFTKRTKEDKAMNVTSDTYDTTGDYGTQSEPLDIGSNSSFNQTMLGQQNNFNSIMNSGSMPIGSTGIPSVDIIKKGIDNVDNIWSGGINVIKQVNEAKRDLKGYSAELLSKGSTLANIALNAQEAKRKRLRDMELQNMELDLYNPNSNNQFKLKSVL